MPCTLAQRTDILASHHPMTDIMVIMIVLTADIIVDAVDLMTGIITSDASPMTGIIDSEADLMTDIVVIVAIRTTDIVKTRDLRVHHRHWEIYRNSDGKLLHSYFMTISEVFFGANSSFETVSEVLWELTAPNLLILLLFRTNIKYKIILKD